MIPLLQSIQSWQAHLRPSKTVRLFPIAEHKSTFLHDATVMVQPQYYGWYCISPLMRLLDDSSTADGFSFWMSAMSHMNTWPLGGQWICLPPVYDTNHAWTPKTKSLLIHIETLISLLRKYWDSCFETVGYIAAQQKKEATRREEKHTESILEPTTIIKLFNYWQNNGCYVFNMNAKLLLWSLFRKLKVNDVDPTGSGRHHSLM